MSRGTGLRLRALEFSLGFRSLDTLQAFGQKWVEGFSVSSTTGGRVSLKGSEL